MSPCQCQHVTSAKTDQTSSIHTPRSTCMLTFSPSNTLCHIVPLYILSNFISFHFVLFHFTLFHFLFYILFNFIVNRSAILLQCTWRTFQARTFRMHQLYSVITIQATVRGFFGELKMNFKCMHLLFRV